MGGAAGRRSEVGGEPRSKELCTDLLAPHQIQSLLLRRRRREEVNSSSCSWTEEEAEDGPTPGSPEVSLRRRCVLFSRVDERRKGGEIGGAVSISYQQVVTATPEGLT